jgi:hypothetical protein
MTCVNGNWTIDTSTPTNTGGCLGTVPGMTCVNGNWIPNSTKLELPGPGLNAPAVSVQAASQPSTLGRPEFSDVLRRAVRA